MAFNCIEWIEADKKYSNNLPDYVLEEKNKLLIIPEHVRDLLPSPTLPVLTFLDTQLPRKEKELIRMKASDFFSKVPPDPIEAYRVLERPIPSDDMLRSLEEGIGQAWLDGKLSILDRRYSNNQVHLPFWIVPFWRKLSAVVLDQDHWRNAHRYFNANQHVLEEPQRQFIENTLRSLPWKESLPFYLNGTAQSSDLAGFLEGHWLADDHIDLMMEYLDHEVSKINGEAKIATLTFQSLFTRQVHGSINNDDSADSGAPAPSRALERLQAAVLDGGFKQLFMPVNVNDSHWVTVFVDFEHKHYGFGDSLPNLAHTPQKLLRGIKQWLKQSFPYSFSYSGETLPHGHQVDRVNCGIFSSNAIEHAVFGAELATNATVTRHRFKWFIRLVESLNEHTSLEWPESAAEPSANEHPAVTTNDGRPGTSHAAASTPSSPAMYTSDWNLSCSSLASVPDHSSVPSSPTIYTSDWNMSCSSLASIPDEIGDASEAPPVSSDLLSDDRDVESLTELTKTGHLNIQSSDSDTDVESDSQSEEELIHEKSDVGKAKKRKRRGSNSVQERKKQTKAKAFTERVRGDDPHAEFDPDNRRRVRHSLCGHWIRMKRLYDLDRWASHIDGSCPKTHRKHGKKGVRAIHGSAGTKSLFSMGFMKGAEARKALNPQRPPIAPSVDRRPCPGLSSKDEPRIAIYLKRSQVRGAGGPDPRGIAYRRYNRAIRDLTDDEKAQVYAENRAGWTWRNEHEEGRCFSVNCERMVDVPNGSTEAPPCSKCDDLFASKAFRNAVAREVPTDGNSVHVPNIYRASVLGQLFARCLGLREFFDDEEARRHPCVRYAKGVLAGSVKHEVVAGIIEALITQYDREEQGLGLQNMRYAPAYDEFCHSLQIQSPAAYRLFLSYLPARSERSFRDKIAREPRFPLEICGQTFHLVAEHLRKLGYTGPTGLSCDDTKLNPSLRIYYDGRSEHYQLIGSAQGPLMVLDPDNMEHVIAKAKESPATKLRLWVLTLEVPKVAPIIVAAMPIANNMNATQLSNLTKDIFLGLVESKIRVVSYAADGTDVEREAQAQFRAVADKEHRVHYTIPNPQPGYSSLEIEISVIAGQPVVMIQDSKHALKTLRNNIYSGATCLVLGNYVSMYQHIDEASEHPASPLYRRDVTKVDRQDDNAATRLFTAQTLKHFIDNYPDYLGDIVYLFVFGELIDAYQNRFISHSERLRMVLRARYFLDRWEAFLNNGGYSKTRYYLSRQAVDILRIIIEGYVSLMYLHRDLLEDIEPRAPFIPWLHSTEACEHVFGEARRIVKDFTALDFVYMIPKLGMKLRQTVNKAQSAKSNTTASGYNHTYLDYHGLDLPTLAVFPADDEINTIAQAAAADADGLFQLLGVTPATLHHMCQLRQTVLPSLSEVLNNVAEDSDSGSDDEDNEWEEEPSESQRIRNMIETEHNPKLSRTRQQEYVLEKMTCASVAVMVDEMTELHKDNANADELAKEGISEEHAQVRMQTESLKLAPLRKYDEWETSRVLFEPGESPVQADMSSLVALRRAHQTRQAEKSTRTRNSRKDEDSESCENGEDVENGRLAIKQNILREMEKSLKAHANQDLGAGTGVERQARWYGNIVAGGNAANAKQVANAAAAEALKHRKSVFLKSNVPLPQDVASARIGARVLQKGDYGVIYTDTGLKIGKVEAIFAKAGGKQGRHEAQAQLTNIARASYITIQVFDSAGLRGAAREFRSKTNALALFQVREYAHVSSVQFLYRLSVPPLLNSLGISLLHDDSQCFTVLSNGFTSFQAAMKVFRKRKRGVIDDDDEALGE